MLSRAGVWAPLRSEGLVHADLAAAVDATGVDAPLADPVPERPPTPQEVL
ncbi:MAG: hypothetical protein GWN71_34180 [Gammaproteobacteria bacterium]|nr:hypothetical protein [Actinomycetota bacterium]NIU78426.1 hypothetical protein [Gammaproteobacteria bacterium]NIX21360.1 hypothetical protein [Actinomycetota bacterium]